MARSFIRQLESSTKSTVFGLICLLIAAALIWMVYQLIANYIQLHQIFDSFSVSYHEFPFFVAGVLSFGAVMGFLFALFIIWLASR